MRTLPPIIVSSVVMAIFMMVSIGAVSKSAAATQNAEQSTEVPEARVVTVEITEVAQEATEEEPEESDSTYSAADRELLAKIAMAEAESEPIEGKALVMLVVLNRVQSEDFPDTIEEVIFQEN